MYLPGLRELRLRPPRGADGPRRRAGGDGRARRERGRRAGCGAPASRTHTACSSRSTSRGPTRASSARAVSEVRRKHGRLLARRHPARGRLVISMPDSSNSAALGFAEETGIPFELGLIRNHYVGPDLHPAGAAVARRRGAGEVQPGGRDPEGQAGRRRGRFDRARNDEPPAGPAPVPGRRHARSTSASSSPPITNPCYYGIDTPRKAELIGNRLDVERIRAFIGATTPRLPDARGSEGGVSAPQLLLLRLLDRRLSDAGAARPDPLVFDVD